MDPFELRRAQRALRRAVYVEQRALGALEQAVREPSVDDPDAERVDQAVRLLVERRLRERPRTRRGYVWVSRAGEAALLAVGRPGLPVWVKVGSLSFTMVLDPSLPPDEVVLGDAHAYLVGRGFALPLSVPVNDDVWVLFQSLRLNGASPAEAALGVAGAFGV